jgi:hypothetical protein
MSGMTTRCLHRLVSTALLIIAVLVSVPVAMGATISFTEAIAEVRDNTCNGEPVTVTGTRHVSITFSNTHTTMHTNWQNTTAMGALTGRYEANDVTRDYFMERRNPGVVTLRENLELISLNPNTPNLILRSTITMDIPGGTIDEDIDLECRG